MDTNNLKELYETFCREISFANNEIRKAGGKLTEGDVEYLDKLTHALKSVKTVIAMDENESEYSGRGSYADGGSYRGSSYGNGSSYARGRRNAPRDSMGRYSGAGYSMHAGMADELRELMQDAPDNVRRELQKAVEMIEQG